MLFAPYFRNRKVRSPAQAGTVCFAVEGAPRRAEATAHLRGRRQERAGGVVAVERVEPERERAIVTSAAAASTTDS
jgi:hypothetical protein